MPYKLFGSDGREYISDVPGTLGGYRPGKIYGRLDCASALRAIGKGGYVGHRVFFADAAAAIAAGYRPCAKCCPAEYQAWKASRAAQDKRPDGSNSS
ncbi:MAG: metal-binding protein [Alphaproteobacteria bacterium]|nr:metal-binding protein [Alphaproteobacteria bacterium]